MTRGASPTKMTIPVLVVLCCWLVAGTSGQRYQQQQRQEPVAPAGKAQQQQPPYYRDALPKSAPAIPRYYPPAPVHYVSIGERLDGEYRFGYDSGNGPAGQSYRQEFRLPDGSIRGSYGYVDSRGHMRKVHYSAGQRGFVILKDERILDKEPPKEGLLMTTDSLHATTPLPPKVDDVPAQELLPRAPQFQEESRQVETQQSPQAAAVAPVPLPSKSAQEIQAEYYRSQLYAAPTVNRQQYAEPDAAAATPLPSEESPQQPLPKPKLSRPRPHRRRYGEYRHRQVYAQPPVVNRMLLSYNIGTGYY